MMWHMTGWISSRETRESRTGRVGTWVSCNRKLLPCWGDGSFFWRDLARDEQLPPLHPEDHTSNLPYLVSTASYYSSRKLRITVRALPNRNGMIWFRALITMATPTPSRAMHEIYEGNNRGSLSNSCAWLRNPSWQRFGLTAIQYSNIMLLLVYNNHTQMLLLSTQWKTKTLAALNRIQKYITERNPTCVYGSRVPSITE